MTKWLSDQVTKWLSDQVTKWPSDQMTEWPSDQVTEWPNVWVTEWPSNRMTDWLSDKVTNWPSNWVPEWLNEQMTELSNDQMTGWQDDRKLRRLLAVWYILLWSPVSLDQTNHWKICSKCVYLEDNILSVECGHKSSLIHFSKYSSERSHVWIFFLVWSRYNFL